MTFQEIKAAEESYIMHTYGRFQIALEKGFCVFKEKHQ